MDTPQNNPEGYAKGSILNMLSGIPDECVSPAIVICTKPRILLILGFHFSLERTGCSSFTGS